MTLDFPTPEQREFAGELADLAGPLLVGLPNEPLVEDWPHIDRQGRRTCHLESVAARSFDSDEPLIIATAADRL